MAIEDWVESNIDSKIKHTGTGREIHVNCPVCGESRYRMFINVENGKVYCHNCNYSSNIVGLIQYVEGISWSRARLILKDVKGNLSIPENVSKQLLNRMFSSNFRSDLQKRSIPLPEEYSLLNPQNTNFVTKRAVKYLHKRGITDKQIIDHKFGFCMTGEYKNRVIIPITEGDELKFWVARAISPDSYLKEKSPSDEDYQISKSEVVFNLDVAAKKYHAAVISEGIFDALAWGDIGISLLGKSLYQEQLNVILDYRESLTNGIYIALDWDAYDKATEIAEELSQFFDVYMINIPKELDDPNNCLHQLGRKRMMKFIEQAEPYGEFSIVKRLLT